MSTHDATGFLAKVVATAIGVSIISLIVFILKRCVDWSVGGDSPHDIPQEYKELIQSVAVQNTEELNAIQFREALNGKLWALCNVGKILVQGRYVPRDIEKARKILAFADSLGSRRAKRMLKNIR